MPIFNNVEIWHIKCDPKRPNSKYNKKNPTWEVQMRTKDRAQKDEWVKGNLRPHPVREDEEGPVLYWRVNLRRKTVKSNGELADPPEVVNGLREPVDPNTVGNGSIANVRVFQYPYTNEDENEEGVANVLMGIQLVRHILYKPKKGQREDFGEVETEVVAPPEASNDDDGDDDIGPDDGDEGQREVQKPSAPRAPNKAPQKAVAGF